MSRESAKAALSQLTDEEADLLNNDPELLGKFRQKHAITETKPSLVKQGWDALAVPEQKSKEGLQMLSTLAAPKTEVTGNLARDVAMNIPRIGLETLAETAPSFISRGAILTGGGLKAAKLAAPAIKAFGGAVAKGSEALTGLEHRTPGVLAEAAKDASIFLGKNKKAASELYEEGKKIGGAVRPALAKVPTKMKFIEKAVALADKGKLNPTEALEARKELDFVKKKVTGEFFRETRAKLDLIAKEAFSKADPAFRKATMTENLRHVLPQNKYGGSSSFKSMLGMTLGVLPLMSPAVAGTVATGVGAATRALAPLGNQAIRSGALLSGAANALTPKDRAKINKEYEETAKKLSVLKVLKQKPKITPLPKRK